MTLRWCSSFDFSLAFQHLLLYLHWSPARWNWCLWRRLALWSSVAQSDPIQQDLVVAHQARTGLSWLQLSASAAAWPSNAKLLATLRLQGPKKVLWCSCLIWSPGLPTKLCRIPWSRYSFFLRKVFQDLSHAELDCIRKVNLHLLSCNSTLLRINFF